MKKLNNGVQIPDIGFGVFRIEDENLCENVVIKAINSGFRLIDTAAAYRNEEAVGRGIKESGVKRDELFITTKLWVTDTTYDKAKRAFDVSLKKLGLDYLDLYIIHQPYNDTYGAWRALEELYKEGRVRAIGVDNFTQDRLADFIYFNEVKPAVNLIECNAFFQRNDEKQFLDREGIVMQAWSPLGAGNSEIMENKELIAIGNKYGKSIAQISLRWLIQRGIIPLVKTTKEGRMRENLDIFDFTLSDEEMDRIALLDRGRSCFPERKNAESVKTFLDVATGVKL